MKLLASILLLFVGLFSVCYAEESDFSYSSYSIPGNDLIGNSFVSAYTGDSQLFSYTRGNNYNYVYTADFLNGILPGNITFTRASAGTYFNSSGVMRTAAADQPRFDYDPATLAPRGLLIEPQRTNLLTYSAEPTNAAWVQSNVTVTANQTIAPDGTMTASSVAETDPAVAHTLNTSTMAYTSGVTYTFWAIVKYDTQQYLQLWGFNAPFGLQAYANFDILNGIIGNVGSSTTARVINLGSGWYIIAITVPATNSASERMSITSVSSLTAGRASTTPGDTANKYYLWAAQMEAGTFPTSYIPTTSAAATRSADYARITNLSTIGYNQSAGTLFVEAETNYASAGTPVSELTLYGVSGNDRTSFIKGSTGGNAFYMITNSVQQINNSLSFVADNTVYRKAIAFSSDGNLSIASNLSGSVTSFSGKTLPSPINGLYIGNVANSSFYNGWIRQIKYYPYKMPDAGLLQLTQ